MRKVLIAVAGLHALVACKPVANGPQSELVLRSYEAPPGYAQEVAGTIHDLLLQGNDKFYGEARLGPGGKILVAAPASFQPGVAQLMEQLGRNPPAPPPSVELSYWLVLGARSDKPQRTLVPETIAATLDAIEKTSGSMSFGMLESLILTSVSGEHGRIQGALASIEQKASALGGNVLADVRIRVHTASVLTVLQIPLDKTVVLGQSSFDATGKGGPGAPTVFYILRARTHAG